MMEFLSTEQADIPLPGPDYEHPGYRSGGAASGFRAPPPPPLPPQRPANPLSGGGAPYLQFFGPKDYVPEVPHLVTRDFNGLEAVAPRSQPRIEEEFPDFGGDFKPAESSKFVQLVPKPR